MSFYCAYVSYQNIFTLKQQRETQARHMDEKNRTQRCTLFEVAAATTPSDDEHNEPHILAGQDVVKNASSKLIAAEFNRFKNQLNNYFWRRWISSFSILALCQHTLCTPDRPASMEVPTLIKLIQSFKSNRRKYSLFCPTALLKLDEVQVNLQHQKKCRSWTINRLRRINEVIRSAGWPHRNQTWSRNGWADSEGNMSRSSSSCVSVCSDQVGRKKLFFRTFPLNRHTPLVLFTDSACEGPLCVQAWLVSHSHWLAHISSTDGLSSVTTATRC